MRNPFSRIPTGSDYVTPHGSRFKMVYESRFNGHKLVLDKVGELDIQEKIEAYAPFTDLNYMLHRLKVGDTSVLASRSPMYGNFLGLPSNPVDVINLVHTAEEQFIQLPVEEKQKFNNDFRVWLSRLFSPIVDTSGNTDSIKQDSDNTVVKE